MNLDAHDPPTRRPARWTFWPGLALLAAAALLFAKAGMIFISRPPPPPSGTPAPVAAHFPWEEIPTPPDTRRLFPRARPFAFQAVYESELSRAEVERFYNEWFTERGWGAAPTSAAPEAPAPDPTRLHFRRGADQALVTFFPGTGAGCDFRVAALRRGAHPSLPGGEKETLKESGAGAK
jgi:hypothetical protein